MGVAVDIEVRRDGRVLSRCHLDGSKKITKIGNGARADLRVADAAASASHAVIEVSPYGVVIIDMGTPLGTQLNGAKIDKADLHSGDEIGIGASTLAVTIVGSFLQRPATGPVAQQRAARVQPPSLLAATSTVVDAHATTSAPATDEAPARRAAAARLDAATSEETSASAVFARAGVAGFEHTIEDHDEALPDDDPILAKMRRSKRRKILAGAVVLPGFVALLGLVGYVALQQHGPRVAEAVHYSTNETRTDEEIAALAMFDADEPRDGKRYLYHRLNSLQSAKDLAERYYGRMSLADVLIAANPRIHSQSAQIAVEKEVRVPRFIEYWVEPGDTIASIATTQLGDLNQQAAIVEANSDVLGAPPTIEPRMRLQIPLPLAQP